MPNEFDLLFPDVEPKPRRVAAVTPRPKFVDPFFPPEPEIPPPAPLPDEPEAPPAFEPEPSGLGVLGTIGDIIDRPGNAVRGLLRGNLGGLKGLIPFSETLGLYDPKTDRTSGRDLLRAAGIENSDDEGFLTPAGIAGFAAENLTDPLNLLPGFFGLKAATKAGKAAQVVGSHLDDAERAVKAASRAKTGLKKQIEAAELAGEVLDEGSIAAAKAALPKARTDLFGDLLGAGEKMAPDAELVSRIAGRGDEVGKAADTLLQTGSDAFRPLENAGDRVRAGQEALLSLGGDYDPLGIFRLGGKYNPINALPKVPGLTAPLELPQKTLIEGADAAQKIQDIGRGIGELPGIRHVKALFSKVPGAPQGTQEVLEQFAKESQQETRAAGAAAEEGARKLNTEIQGMGDVTLKPAVIEPTLADDVIEGEDGSLLDPLTGEVLRDGPAPAQAIPSPLRETPLSNDAQALLDEELNPTQYPQGWDVTRFPDLPGSAPKKPYVEGARTTPLQDVTGRPQIEDFETPRKGQVVRFSPRAALHNPAGLKRPQSAKIEQIFDFQGQTVAQLEGGWTVPLSAVKRPAANVRANFQEALDMYERERMWKGKTPTEIKRLKDQARDARAALEQATDTGELIGLKRNAALKGDRNDILADLGMKDTGDLEQAKALPKILERALQKGATPQLKTIDFLNLESGALGVGDVLRIGGDKFTLEGLDPETGLVRLQDGIPIDVPMDRIPVDKGSSIERGVTDAELARRAETFDPLGILPAGSAPAEGPRIASATDVGGAGSAPKKFERLNKAADVLAGAEAKLGVQPADIPREIPERINVERILAQRDVRTKYMDDLIKSGGKYDQRVLDDLLKNAEPQSVADLGRSEVPDIMADLLKPQAAPKVSSSIGEASNPSYMREFAERSDDAAARAVDAREATRQQIIDSGGGTDAAIDRFRVQDNVARQAEQTAKAAQKLADAGENLQQAAKTSREMMEGRSLDAGRAITEALENPNVVAPQDVAGTVQKIRARYDEIGKLEEGMTPMLSDERVKYVTHVPTEAGRKFFLRMAKNKGNQAALFVELEKKRMGAGLPGNLEDAAKASMRGHGDDLPTDPKFRAEVQAERAKGKRAPSRTSKPVPVNVMREWETAALKMAPENRKFIEDNGLMKEYLDFGRDFALEHGSQIPRLKQYKGLTVNELNDVMGKFGSGGPVYNPNPAAQLFTREMRHAKLMAGKSFLEKTAEQFGKPGANIPEIMRDVADDSLSPEGFRQMMGIEDPQTAKAAFDTLKRMTDEEAVGEVLGWFDKVTRAWKGWITRGFPAYHVRNHIGNRFQAWLTGVPLAGEHIQNGHKLVAGTDFKTIAGDGKVLDRDTLLKEMQQTGALKGGFFEENLAETLDETASKWDPLNPDNMFIRGAERVSAGLAGGLSQAIAGAPKNALKMDGNAIEAADRASVFLYWRQKGFSPRAAAEKVDQALFDYSKENLSPFEQQYMNRAVFFYGYMRNVLPFMAGAMSENGAKVAQMLKLGTQPGRPDFVPEYAAAGLQLPLGKDEEGNSKMAYSLGTPLESVAEPFAQNPATLLNPFIKIPLELMTGQDFFLGKAIEDAKKAPNWVDNSPDILQDLLGTVKTPTKTGGTRVEIDPNIAYALRNNPFSRIGTTASKIFDERKDAPDILQNLLSGMRVVSIDDEQEKMWAAKDQAKDILRDLARQGKVKVGKYESFGRGANLEKGEDPMVDLLLGIAQGR